MTHDTKIKPVLTLIICGVLIGCSTASKSSSTQTPAADPPKLLKPIVKKIWIPPEIRSGGAEWVEGHFIYRIEKETVWSR